MTKRQLHETVALTLTLVASLAIFTVNSQHAPFPDRTEPELAFPRFSVFPGEDIIFEADMMGEPAIYGEWYRDWSSTDIKRLTFERAYCFDNFENLTTWGPIKNSTKYVVTWDQGSGTSSLEVKNASIEDAGVYCFTGSMIQGNLTDAYMVAGYLQVTIDDHALYIPMTIFLSCLGGWLLILLLVTGLSNLFAHLEQKKQDKLILEKSHKREMVVLARNMELAPGSPATSRIPLIHSAANLTTPSYGSAGQSNLAYVASMPNISEIATMRRMLRPIEQSISPASSITRSTFVSSENLPSAPEHVTFTVHREGPEIRGDFDTPRNSDLGVLAQPVETNNKSPQGDENEEVVNF